MFCCQVITVLKVTTLFVLLIGGMGHNLMVPGYTTSEEVALPLSCRSIASSISALTATDTAASNAAAVLAVTVCCIGVACAAFVFAIKKN